MRPLLTFLALFAIALASPRPAPAGETASVRERAVASLKQMFGDSVVVTETRMALTRADQEAILGASQSRWAHDTVVVFRCAAGGRTAGYGFLDDVKGKMQMITMLVGLVPDGTVRDVDILVYRESYGGEVANESFRRQFRGLAPGSDIRPGAAIRNISGATISARAVTFGVRKVSATYTVLKERLPR
jgi:Na+-translocating ferredoxin:NAD+ oxidoreductase RnfG subunit